MRMGRTVGELLESMSAGELVHWFALYDIDPWTEDRADLRSAMQCATIANCLSTRGGVELDQFLLKFNEQEAGPAEEVDEQQLKFAGMRWCAMLGGKVTKG